MAALVPSVMHFDAFICIRTDEIIQQAIRENFSECTVVTIAHRLNTVMDSDRIMVYTMLCIVSMYLVIIMRCLFIGDEQWWIEGGR